MKEPSNQSYSYIAERGESPNAVMDAGVAYLKSAQAEYRREADQTSFFHISRWYVVHHLSIIAVELLLKSLRVTITHTNFTLDSNDDVNYDERYQHAYIGHAIKLDSLDAEIVKNLLAHLTAPQVALLNLLSNNEFIRGRYPYEELNGGHRFPIGDEGKILTEKWLELAESLSKFADPRAYAGRT